MSGTGIERQHRLDYRAQSSKTAAHVGDSSGNPDLIPGFRYNTDGNQGAGRISRFIEPAFAILAAPLKHLIGIDIVRPGHCRHRSSGLQRLFNYQPPLLPATESSLSANLHFHTLPVWRLQGLDPIVQTAMNRRLRFNRAKSVKEKQKILGELEMFILNYYKNL